MGEVAKLLRELLASGQFGIIIIALIIVIGAAVLAIYLQRQTLSQIKSLLNAANLNMQAADRVRAETKAAQDEQRERWQSQYDVVRNTNEELRKELERLSKELERIRSDQQKLEDNVKESIRLGFNQMKSYVNQRTVREIIEQVPESFRADLIKETERAVEAGSDLLNQRLNDAYRTMTDELERIKENIKTESLELIKQGIIERAVLQEITEKTSESMLPLLRANIEKTLESKLELPPYFGTDSHPRFVDYLAHKIAFELAERGFIDYLARRIVIEQEERARGGYGSRW
jgi:hypothetical protein